VADYWRSVPGWAIDLANKLLKPLTNFWTTYRRLAQSVSDGSARRDVYQPMAKWVATTRRSRGGRSRSGSTGSTTTTR
jgi:hypothetical protein